MSLAIDLPDSETSTIGARIRAARRARHLNQGALAQKLRVSQPTIANWESGIHDPRQLMLAKIAEALQVSLGWLASGERSELEKDRHPAAAYLRRLVVHVPVVPIDQVARVLDEPDLDFHALAVDYIPITAGASTMAAIFMRDDAMNLAFPVDTLVVVNYAERNPAEGALVLVQYEGAPILRRWRTNPPRLEPISSDPSHKPIFLDRLEGVIGTLFISIRFH